MENKMDKSNWTLRYNRTARDIYGKSLTRSDFGEHKDERIVELFIWCMIGIFLGALIF